MKAETADIMVVDDDESLRRVIEYNMVEEGYRVVTAADGESALEALNEGSFDLVLTDINMPGMDGMELLAEVKRRSPSTEVIVITAFGTIEMAVEAMKAGAYDYITKPFNRDELKIVAKKALRIKALIDENQRLKTQNVKKFGYENIIGNSTAMQKVFRMIDKVADTEASVLISGESGTGKELVALALHNRSSRADKPFIPINCAAIPRELLESELFGYKKGAFTGAQKDKKGRFEAANGGTIFLDEIGELSIDLQAKILRALQYHEFTPVGGSEVVYSDARIVSATNKDLEKAIEDGSFREDLYYRLAVVPIHIPPLRERPDDIPLLVDHFVNTLANGERTKVSPDAIEALSSFPWKGNVRELENTIERTLILKEGENIEVDDLPSRIKSEKRLHEDKRVANGDLGGVGGLADAERTLIMQALEKSGWNKSKAARILKIARHVLIYRMEKYGIPKKSPE